MTASAAPGAIVTLLLGFLPLVAFSLLEGISVSLALWLSLGLAFTLGMRAFLETGRLRRLDVAFVVLFAGLALYDGFVEPGMATGWVELVLHAGLFAVAAWSLATRRPFTGPYVNARDWPEDRDTPMVLRKNMLLSGVWTATFAVMAGADAVTIFLHIASPVILAAAGLAVLAGALTFTWQTETGLGRRALGRE